MRIRNWVVAAGAVLAVAACSDPTVPDYNNLTEDNFRVINTRAQLQQLAIGLVDADRLVHDFQILLNETVARNVYRIDPAETRYLTTPLGQGTMSPDNFVGQAVFAGPYRTIRSAENMLQAIEAGPDEIPQSAGGTATPFNKAAARGYVQTFKALSYLRLIEQRDTVGISIYTTPTSVNPLRCKEDILDYIVAVLDSADNDLEAGSSSGFGFSLPSGFTGFDTPATFREFTNALRARAEVYRAFDLYARTGGVTPGASTAKTINTAALDAAQAALDASFLDVNGDPDLGVYHTYSSASGDYLNPNFGADVYRINPRVVREAEGTVINVVGNDTTYTVADTRVRDKVDLTFDPDEDCLSAVDVGSCFRDQVNESAEHPLPIIRNDELALLQAEVYWGRNQDAQALTIVNRFRALGGFTVPATAAQLATTWSAQLGRTVSQHDAVLYEILRQKRYQLLFESATRLPDYRMFGILNDLGRERGNDPIASFPLPSAEVLARNNDVTRTCSR